MKRRNFLTRGLLGASGIGLSSFQLKKPDEANGRKTPAPGTFSYDDNKITFYIDELLAPVKVIQVTDTHLWMDDQRGAPWQQFSERMAKAYNVTQHYKTGTVTNPKECFLATLKMAVEKKADLFAMTGDIFNFPSEAAIEWVNEQLQQTSIPYLYVAGNHDWHYEGMEGSIDQLRNTWINNRLKSLYQGNNTQMAAYTVKGITFLTIDNSTYGVTREQLDFFAGYAAKKTPLVLMVHIPLYAPGRGIGFGCGNPEWSAKTDNGYKVERRERWRESGHTKVTFDFYNKVFSTPNLLGIFAGHVHRQSFDLVNGKPQFVSEANLKGAYFEIDFVPTKSAGKQQ